MARNTSRLKNTDFEILYTGTSIRKGVLPTVDSPPFGESEKDYIEMLVSTTTGTILDSFIVSKGADINQHFDEDGKFVKINPGIFLREKGYFSGDYNIEFNFLREIAGSVDDTILLDKDNKPYDGPMFIDDDGNVLKSEIEIINDEEVVKPVKYSSKILLREVSLKYYIDEISSDRTELRLLPFSIDDKVYKQEFKGIGKEKIVITYDNTINAPAESDGEQSRFRIVDYENIDDKLRKQFEGGELVVSDAYEIVDLTDVDENVNFLVGEETKNGFLTWGDNWKGLVKGGKSNNYRIHGGDNNAYVDVPNANHPVSQLRGGYIKDFVITHEDRNDVDDCLFEEIGQGDNSSYTSGKASEDFMSKRASLGVGDDRSFFLGGAAIMGYNHYEKYGFPLWIRVKGELTKLKGAKLTINIDGEVIGGTNGASQTKFTGQKITTFNGEDTFVRILTPMDTTDDDGNDARAGVLVNLSVKFEHDLWTGYIDRNNVFAIAPDDDKDAYKNFVNAGFEGGRS